MAIELTNAGFESGNTTGWTVTQVGGTGTASASTERPYSGSYSGLWTGNSGTGHGGGVEAIWLNDIEGTVYEGQAINAQCQIALKDTGLSQNRAEIRLYWFDEDHVQLGYNPGTLIRGNNSQYRLSAVSATAPANARYVRVAVWTTANYSGGILFDAVTWDYEYDRTIELTSPLDNASFPVDSTITFSVNIEGTTPSVVSVEYRSGGTPIGGSVAAPYSIVSDDLGAGPHVITAVATLSDGTTVTSAAHDITVTATPNTREYRASNSYSYLVVKDFIGLSSFIPSVARVTGVEVELDYTLRALIRSLDTGADPEDSTDNVAFDITNGGVIELVSLEANGSSYDVIGSSVTAQIPIDRSDFTVAEEGVSDGKKWTVMDGVATSTTVGGEDILFGGSPMAVADFLNRSLGVRFYPNLGTKPAYAASGDACFRFFINKLRVMVYFDAGSADYVFANPLKTQVIRGELVASYVDSGDFETGDASGVLQLKPTLEILDGTQTYIGPDWTIHAAYPPTDANQIGEVVASEFQPNSGMDYNGLPSYSAVTENRSRYVMITANFYGDRNLDSIYGAHGLPRAFAYNGDFFYKIHTQADPDKDEPRHVAYHHAHLALGYDDGRVDVSVVGSPWNFDGAMGASSHTIGDKVTGLLPLSGTILGIFGSKSIWGISGTTVDNFSTQVISPNIGAIEYTICDMGEPVYANAYGIYTLSQTQRYGDYLGTPMSQDVSPWLRPRLVRKYTSDKEVVVAWPVRAKNQYRLAFSDGYVLSMTMNGQTVPTFSFQNYYIY